MTNTIPRLFKKITFRSLAKTSATMPGDIFDLLVDEDGNKHIQTQDGKRWRPNYSLLRSAEMCEIISVER